jgi:hypothetical protein
MAVLIKSGNTLVPVGNSFSLTQGITDDEIIQRKITAFSGSYVNSTASYIGPLVFYKSSTLTNITCTACNRISQSAFKSCSSLITASFPVCTRVDAGAFQYCSVLESIYFPVCSTLGGGAFEGCRALTTIAFPICQSIGNGVFEYCAFSSIILPECSSLGGYVFYGCKDLKVVYLPKCQELGYDRTFGSCYNLLSLYLLTSTILSLPTINIFISTPISDYTTFTSGVHGSIFVRASLLSTFQTATN